MGEGIEVIQAVIHEVLKIHLRRNIKDQIWSCKDLEDDDADGVLVFDVVGHVLELVVLDQVVDVGRV